MAVARPKQSPQWLADRRQSAWDAFQALPMPSSAHDEDWRRTDISALHIEEFLESSDTPTVSPIENADELRAQGVIVTSLDDAAINHRELLEETLATVSVSESKLLALWNARWSGGCFIHVPRGVTGIAPLRITTPSHTSAVFPATLAIIDEGASLEIVESYGLDGATSPSLSNAVTNIIIKENASCRYTTVQQWGDQTWHFATQRFHLAQHARLDFFGATVGARLQKSYWEALLNGEGAEATFAGVAVAKGTQHLDHQSLQRHVAANTRSNLLLKVVARDTARSVYSGLIDVEEAAQHMEGYVANRNLLLSQGAKADSIPRLEIKANDVRCGHGSATGHIDDDERFYLLSRGISPSEADFLIVKGFLQEALLHIVDESLRQSIDELLVRAVGTAHE